MRFHGALISNAPLEMGQVKRTPSCLALHTPVRAAPAAPGPPPSPEARHALNRWLSGPRVPVFLGFLFPEGGGGYVEAEEDEEKDLCPPHPAAGCLERLAADLVSDHLLNTGTQGPGTPG
jgi:hypothetical protein